MKIFDVADYNEFKCIILLPWLTLSEIDVSKFTNMSWLFHGMDLTGQDLSNWDVSNVWDMTGMFDGSTLDSDLSKWDVRKVECMTWMFENSRFRGDLSNWDVKEQCDVRWMFTGSSLTDKKPEWYKWREGEK